MAFFRCLLGRSTNRNRCEVNRRCLRYVVRRMRWRSASWDHTTKTADPEQVVAMTTKRRALILQPFPSRNPDRGKTRLPVVVRVPCKQRPRVRSSFSSVAKPSSDNTTVDARPVRKMLFALPGYGQHFNLTAFLLRPLPPQKEFGHARRLPERGHSATYKVLA